MGHSTINVTLGTYGHLFPAIDAELDVALGQRFSQAKAAETAKIEQLRIRRS